MTAYYPLALRRAAAQQLQIVLDGAPATAVVTWSLYGQRPRLNVYGDDGALVVAVPVVGSADPLAIISATYSALGARVIYTLTEPHGVPVGEVLRCVVRGCTPEDYNGAFDALASSPTALTRTGVDMPPASDLVAPGAVYTDVDLVAGYYIKSSLVYRASTGNFEVSP